MFQASLSLASLLLGLLLYSSSGFQLPTRQKCLSKIATKNDDSLQYPSVSRRDWVAVSIATMLTSFTHPTSVLAVGKEEPAVAVVEPIRLATKTLQKLLDNWEDSIIGTLGAFETSGHFPPKRLPSYRLLTQFDLISLFHTLQSTNFLSFFVFQIAIMPTFPGSCWKPKISKSCWKRPAPLLYSTRASLS